MSDRRGYNNNNYHNRDNRRPRPYSGYSKRPRDAEPHAVDPDGSLHSKREKYNKLPGKLFHILWYHHNVFNSFHLIKVISENVLRTVALLLS